jgi:hypothetical protein
VLNAWFEARHRDLISSFSAFGVTQLACPLAQFPLEMTANAGRIAETGNY